MLRVQSAVVGGGVVGLAIARALAASGREVVIIESTDLIGSGSSSRNSEVVHAGIYYPRGSLKARACVEGRRLLYAFCDAHGVETRRCGKLLVATEVSELAALQGIVDQARGNGLHGPEEGTPSAIRSFTSHPRAFADAWPFVRRATYPLTR